MSKEEVYNPRITEQLQRDEDLIRYREWAL
jgi:hypothetical protein